MAARIALTAAGDIDLSSGKMVLETDAGKSVTAKVKKVLNLWQASWFLAAADGIPYLQKILNKKNPDLRLIENILRDTISAIPEIISIASLTLTYNRSARSLSVQTSLFTTKGGVVVTAPLALP